LQDHRLLSFKDSDALAIVCGEKAEGSSTTNKAQALQLWLLGVELSYTVILLTEQETTILTSTEKGPPSSHFEDSIDMFDSHF